MARALKAVIDREALKHNIARVRALTDNKKILAMVKANGYGHGIIHVAEALEDADAFGVACIEEAVELREAGIQNRIVLMEGFFETAELPELVRLNLEPVVHHESQVKALSEFTGSLRLWIKVNTGMNRLGFPMAAVKDIYHRLHRNTALAIEGFMTHFAKADEVEDPLNQIQLTRFHEVVKGLPGTRSLANSAAILANRDFHGDWVRPGILLYGVSPFAKRNGFMEGVLPVMSLESAIIAIHDLHAGESVGYGGDYVCPRAMRIGVVALGYGDGYPLAPIGTPVLVNGQKTHLVGRVAMDMVTVNLSDQPEAAVGDPVVLWGPLLPIEEVAAAMCRSAYELLTGLSPRVPFLLR